MDGIIPNDVFWWHPVHTLPPKQEILFYRDFADKSNSTLTSHPPNGWFHPRSDKEGR